MARKTAYSAFGMPWYYYVGVLVVCGAGWAIASQVEMFELPWKETAVVSSLAAFVLVCLPAFWVFVKGCFSKWGKNNDNLDFSFTTPEAPSNSANPVAAPAHGFKTPILGQNVRPEVPGSESDRIIRRKDRDEDDDDTASNTSHQSIEDDDNPDDSSGILQHTSRNTN
jgi:hypothetical protein